MRSRKVARCTQVARLSWAWLAICSESLVQKACAEATAAQTVSKTIVLTPSALLVPPAGGVGAAGPATGCWRRGSGGSGAHGTRDGTAAGGSRRVERPGEEG